MLSAGLHDKIQKPEKETVNFYFSEMIKSTNIVETKELFLSIDTYAQIGFLWEEVWIRPLNVQLSQLHSSQLQSPNTPTANQEVFLA
jgi:hypothetical protein